MHLVSLFERLWVPCQAADLGMPFRTQATPFLSPDLAFKPDNFERLLVMKTSNRKEPDQVCVLSPAFWLCTNG